MKRKAQLDISLKLLAKTSFIVFGGLFLSKLVTYIYRIIVARYYGPDEYGLFSLAIVMLGLLLSIASFGLSDGLQRYIPFYRGKEDHDKIKLIFKYSLIFSVISGLTFFVILYLSSGFIANRLFHDARLIVYLKIFSFILPINLIANLYAYFLKAYEKTSWFSFNFNILQNVTRLISIVLLVYLGVKNAAVPISYSIGIIFMLISSYVTCRKILPDTFIAIVRPIKERKKIFGEFFSYSWPFIFISLISSLLFWIDSFSIGYFKTAFEVGLYNAATPIGGLLSLSPEIFMQLLFPMITRHFAKKKLELVKELVKQVSKWILIINLPLAMAMMIFPGVFINILFGTQYLGAENVLRILAVSGIFSSLAIIPSSILTMFGKTKLVLGNLIALSVLNLILNSIFVPIYGINGAAFATMICSIMLTTILFFQSKRISGFAPFRRIMIQIVFASCVPFIFLLIVSQFYPSSIAAVIISGIIAALMYFGLLFLIKGFDKSDFGIIEALRRKVSLNTENFRLNRRFNILRSKK